MYVKDEVLWSVRQCGTMVDVSQVMIDHTITCQIHVSRHTTPLRNELSCSCRCTEILALLTMKLELLSPLLSDSPFLSSKVFFFSDFRIWLLNGQNEIMLVEDLENFPFWIVFWCFRDPSILLPLDNPLSEWKFHKKFLQKPRPA